MDHFYVGSCTEFVLQGHRFERLGDKATFKNAEEADIVVRGGGQFITEDEFKACGFTADELRKFAYVGRRHKAPASFLAKLDQAHEFFRARRHELLQRQAELEAAPPAELAEATSQPEAPAEEVSE